MKEQTENTPFVNLEVEITRTPVTSSQIESVGYDGKTETLEIEFKAKGDNPGSVYRYGNVTKEIAEAFLKAGSVGSFFYSHIKPNPASFPYKRVS